MSGSGHVAAPEARRDVGTFQVVDLSELVTGAEEDLPANQIAFIKINAELALADGWKSITKRKAPLPDADDWKDKPNKISELVK